MSASSRDQPHERAPAQARRGCRLRPAQRPVRDGTALGSGARTGRGVEVVAHPRRGSARTGHSHVHHAGGRRRLGASWSRRSSWSWKRISGVWRRPTVATPTRGRGPEHPQAEPEGDAPMRSSPVTRSCRVLGDRISTPGHPRLRRRRRGVPLHPLEPEVLSESRSAGRRPPLFGRLGGVPSPAGGATHRRVALDVAQSVGADVGVARDVLGRGEQRRKLAVLRLAEESTAQAQDRLLRGVLDQAGVGDARVPVPIERRFRTR